MFLSNSISYVSQFFLVSMSGHLIICAVLFQIEIEIMLCVMTFIKLRCFQTFPLYINKQNPRNSFFFCTTCELLHNFLLQVVELTEYISQILDEMKIHIHVFMFDHLSKCKCVFVVLVFG